MSRPRVALVIGILVLVAGGAFVIGRATAPDASAADHRCGTAEPRMGIALPDDHTGYFSQCEMDFAGSARSPESRDEEHIDVYKAPTGNAVVAWFYVNCDLEHGIVAPGDARPNDCATTGTTV